MSQPKSMHKVSDHINSFQLPVCTTNSNFLLDITVMSPTAITSLWNNTFHNHSVLSHSALNGCAESCCAGKVLRGIVGQTLSLQSKLMMSVTSCGIHGGCVYLWQLSASSAVSGAINGYIDTVRFYALHKNVTWCNYFRIRKTNLLGIRLIGICHRRRLPRWSAAGWCWWLQFSTPLSLVVD